MTQTVLVTGGARRLGAAIARRLASDGWRVVVHHRNSGDEAAALGVLAGAVLGAGGAAKAVAYAVGFRSSSSFCHAFRKATGQTPQQYRHALA